MRTHFFLTLTVSLSLSLCKKSNQLWIVCYGVWRGGGEVALRVKRPDSELSAAAIAASKDRERERREVARTS